MYCSIGIFVIVSKGHMTLPVWLAIELNKFSALSLIER